MKTITVVVVIQITALLIQPLIVVIGKKQRFVVKMKDRQIQNKMI